MRFTILFFVLSASLSATNLDHYELRDLKSRYGCLKNAFDNYDYNQRTMEIKFIREDKTVCGVHWDLFKIQEEDHHLWCAVSQGITDIIFFSEMFTPRRVNHQDIVRGLTTLKASLMKEDCTARHIYSFRNGGLELLTAQNIDEILDASCVTPWTLTFTERALQDNIPGTLFITALGAECCLMRKPAPPAPAPITMQEQKALTARLRILEDKVGTISRKMVHLDAWGHLNNVLSRFQEKLGSLEATVGDLKQRVEVLESKEQTDTERKVALT